LLRLNFPRLEFPIKDWVIRFNVAIGQTKIEPYEEEYEQVRAALQQPGDYSIETLFLDLRGKHASSWPLKIGNRKLTASLYSQRYHLSRVCCSCPLFNY
jgi:hypothetical protein